jgi:hypothetical protein
MKDKKIAADWIIALVYCLILEVCAMLLNIFTALVLKVNFANMGRLEGVIFQIFVTWASCICAAQLNNKVYVIKNSREVVKLATIYNFTFSLLSWCLFSSTAGANRLFLLVGAFLWPLVFFLFSKKYIKNNSET